MAKKIGSWWRRWRQEDHYSRMYLNSFEGEQK